MRRFMLASFPRPLGLEEIIEGRQLAKGKQSKIEWGPLVIYPLGPRAAVLLSWGPNAPLLSEE